MTDAPCRILEWDSEFFGCRIASVTVPHLRPDLCATILSWCEAHEIDCLYFLAAPDDCETSALALRNEFQLVDVRLDFERPVVSRGRSHSGSSIRAACDSDLPELHRIAAQAHHATRFYFDPRFPRDRCDDLYRTWITRSCGGFADGVQVMIRDGCVAGYITMHLEEASRGGIGLVGVAEAWRGRGIGSQLVDSAIEWFGSRRCTCVRVATQARNVPGVRLYERSGFQLARVRLWYHHWFDRSPPGI